MSQRTGYSYRFYDTGTAWSACLAAEARIWLRPRVRREQPVEGWDSNPHPPDPQSDALPLSYLPHDDHDPPVGVEPTSMALQAMSFTVGYGGMNPGRPLLPGARRTHDHNVCMHTESAGFEPAGGNPAYGLASRCLRPGSANFPDSAFRPFQWGIMMRPSCGYGEGWIRTTVSRGT